MSSVVLGILCSFLFIPASYSAVSSDTCRFQDLSDLAQNQPAAAKGGLRIWRSTPLPYHVRHCFSDLLLDLSLTDPDTFNMYSGSNCSAVQEQHAAEKIFFGFFRTSSLFRRHQLNAFNETFIGMETTLPYRIGRTFLSVNPVRVGVFAAGVLLFLFSPVLVRNVVFYYTSGCTAGVLAAVLLVAIIVYRMAPKKTIGIPIIIGGWTVTGFILKSAYNNMSSLMNNYYQYVISYFVVWIVLSLAYCYRRGPPTDHRSFNLMQWTMQVVACLLVYFSLQLTEVSAAVIALLLVSSFVPILSAVLLFPFTVLLKILSFISRPFRRTPKPRFLTQDEYERQMRDTTERELRRLKEFCRSPDANWMKITRNVRDPKKLSRFAEGLDDHVAEEEFILHEHAADMLDRSEIDYEYMDDDEQEYRGWETELRSRRPASSTSLSGARNLQSQKQMRARLMERGSATTSRLPVPRTSLRSKTEGSTRRSFPARGSGRRDDIGEEEEVLLLRQLASVRRQKAINQSGLMCDTSEFMDSDEERDQIKEEDLFPDEDDIDEVY